ncbi:MAG: YhcH/YjgK/YiaL family protein [Hoylesella enoeca]|uniref:YhcH/YjgK/YiaL family protein n=1 Tax=Hoylesella enoeca TaxID=76123 RepID=UPI003F9F0559
MIIDTLDYLEKYFSLNPLFRDVIDFIHSNDVERMPLGKHLIKGDDLFVNIAKFKGKAKAEAVLESHRRMIDIAICFNADETFGYTPAIALPEAEYHSEDDFSIYPGIPAQTYLSTRPGMFTIFFPNEGHAPCISQESELHKAIFKIKA